MSDQKQYSKLIRIICGVLGLSGLAAIAFNYFHTGKFSFGFLLFAQLFAIFLFIYVAIWGASPIDDRLKK